MIFTPLNKHIEVEPIEEQAVISAQNATFEEKGKILSFDEDDCEYSWEVGHIIYFDAWQVAKYMDSNGKERYLVPEAAVRACESPDE